MKLTKKKSFTRSITSLGMALLVMGFASGCSKQLLPQEIEANNGNSGGMTTGLSGNGGGINEGNVGGGNTGGTAGTGSAGTGFGIQGQSETGSPNSGPGNNTRVGLSSEGINEGTVGEFGHAGSGPNAFGSEDQDFGTGSGPMPGNGSDGSAPKDGTAPGGGSGSSGDSFSTFGEGNKSGGVGTLGEGSGGLEHDPNYQPYHTGPSGVAGGSPVGSGAPPMGGMDPQVARLADFVDSTDLNDIHFSYDQYDLTEESKEVLRTNASWLNSNPAARIEIQGHCDERGTNNYNLGLGERRALSTKKFLTALGVDANRIFTISYGEEKPFCFDSNDACWNNNRRAHFMIAR